MALSSLRKREINMFLKAKQAACGVCVWASLIPPDVFGEKLLLKKNYHISRSSGFLSNIYLQNHYTCDGHVHKRDVCACVRCSSLGPLYSWQSAGQYLRRTNDKLTRKINTFQMGKVCRKCEL